MGMLLASSKWLQRPNPGKRKKPRLEPLAVGFSVVHIFAGEPISPVSCPMPPGPRSRSPVRLFHAVSGRQPPPVWPRPLRPGPTHNSFSVPSSSTEPPRLSPGTRLCRPGSLWLSRSFPSTSVYKTATLAGLPSLLSPNLSTIRPLRSAISSTTSQLSTTAIVFPHTTTPFPRLPSLPQPKKLPPSSIRLPTLSKNYNL